MESDSILLRNDLQELKRLHAFFQGLVQSLGFTEKALFHINLVCDELVTNIILYGYPPEEIGLHPIRLDIGRVPEGWELRLTDRGKPFNPLLRATPQTDLSIEERGIGGLGIHFVKQVMDELHYERFNEENILLMRKNRTGEEEVS